MFDNKLNVRCCVASLEQPRIGIPTSLVELPLLVIMVSNVAAGFLPIRTYLIEISQVDINATRPYVLHWLQTNLQPDRIDTQPSEITFLRGSPNSPPIASYANPRPPAGTGPHRYTLFVFRQPENFTIPPDYASFGNSSRASFNFPDFIAQTGLNMPVAANYFFSENTTVSSQNGTSNCQFFHPSKSQLGPEEESD